MEIEHLYEFCVLASTKNYGRAADQLFVNQSKLTKHIQKIEREVGVALFNREGRSVELTQFGKLFLPYAKKVCAQSDESKERMDNLKSRVAGRVEVGSISTMAEYRITDALMAFHKNHPHIEIKVIEDDSAQHRSLSQHPACEIFFAWHSDECILNALSPAYESFSLLEDELVVLLPPRHRLAQSETLNLADLARDDFALLQRSSELHALSIEAFRRSGFEPHVILESDNTYNLFDLATQGLADALVMRVQTIMPHNSKLPQHSQFAVRSLKPALRAQLRVYHLRDEYLSEGARLLLTFLREQKDLIFTQ